MAPATSQVGPCPRRVVAAGLDGDETGPAVPMTVRARMRPGTTSCSPRATTRRTWVHSRPHEGDQVLGDDEPTVMTASMRSACRV